MIDTARFSAAATAEGFELTARQLEQFDQYAQFLVEYNEKVNLTAITNPEGIEVKHFLDSLMLLKAVELPEGASVIDVGTGAGFPSVPAKIVRDDLRLTLLDGLGKRIVFLGELSRRLGQENTALHARAEEAARGELREQFDLATARAVADLRVLAEYCLPLVKVGGRFIAMKGAEADAEAKAAANALKKLGGQYEETRAFTLPDGSARGLVFCKKISQTPTVYPRNGGKIAKKPL